LAPVSAAAARPRFISPFAAIAALCLWLGATSADAQSSRIPANAPDDAVLHLIVPIPPGGTTDTVGRGGSMPHLLGMSLARDAGIDLAHAPYLAAGLLNADVAHGTIAVAVSATSDYVPLHRAGRLPILATTAAQRSAVLPDAPAFAKLGWPSMTASGWITVFAPTGTPRAIADALADAVNVAMRDPAVTARFAPLVFEGTSSTLRELAAAIVQTRRHWAPLLRQAGLVEQAGIIAFATRRWRPLSRDPGNRMD